MDPNVFVTLIGDPTMGWFELLILSRIPPPSVCYLDNVMVVTSAQLHNRSFHKVALRMVPPNTEVCLQRL